MHQCMHLKSNMCVCKSLKVYPLLRSVTHNANTFESKIKTKGLKDAPVRYITFPIKVISIKKGFRVSSKQENEKMLFSVRAYCKALW